MGDQSQTSDASVRCVLQGVPWMGFYRGGPRPPEDDMLPACVRAFLEWKGEDLGFARETGRDDPWHDVHVYLMAASGAAFRLHWSGDKWDPGAGGVLDWAPQPLEPFTRVLWAAGYGCEVLLRQERAAALGLQQDRDYTEADFRAHIIESIRDKGRPVIALGVVGPPEPCLITGYDESGDVLIGWSHFQSEAECSADLEFEPVARDGDPGYFRKRDWLSATHGLVLIGDPIPRPSERELLRDTLRYALQLMRTPLIRGLQAGQAAFTSWADMLLDDSQFPADDLEIPRVRHLVQANVTGALAESRAWGSWYLNNMARREPRIASHLLDAASCFDDEHDLVWAMWQFVGGLGHSDEHSHRLSDAGTRGRIVPLIRLARDEDAAAAQHLERALAVLDAEAGETSHRCEPSRIVLDGVPKVGYGVHLCCLPGSLRAVMQYIGESFDYDYLMGVSGAPFRRLWNRDDGGNVDLMYLQPEPYIRVFEALNYDHRVIPYGDKAAALRAVRQSLARRRPVLAFGIIGPPECGIVAGYDEEGDVLLGYSYFQDGSLSGYYQKRDWYEETSPAGGPEGRPVGGMAERVLFITVGDKRRWPGPPKRDVLRSSLKWAIDLARVTERPGLPNHVSGLAACEAWAAALEIDDDYPTDDAETMGTRVMIHGDQCVMLEDRRSAAGYLRQMADAAPEAAEALHAAADLYEQVAAIGPEVWPWGCEDGAGAAKGLSDPQTRRTIAGAVRLAGEKETEAVAHLEAALAAMASPQ